MRLGRDARRIAADESPQHRGLFGIRHRHEVEQHREGDRRARLVAAAGCDELRRRRLAGMEMPDGIHQARLRVLRRVLLEERQIIVDLARDDVEIEPLRLARLVVHEQAEAVGRAIGEPLVDGQAVALRLGDLLALVVEEELVVEAFRRQAAERLARSAPESFTLSMRSLPAIS